MKKLCLLLTVLTLGLASMAAQAQKGPEPVVVTTNTSRTTFGSFIITPDALLVKGATIIGTLNNEITYPVEIRAERVLNAQTSNVVYAVSFRTTVGHDTHIDYVDYDELDSLIQGIQAIAQANSTVTPFDNFEAVIRTRSGLSIAKIGKGPKNIIAITAGGMNPVHNQMASFVLDDLSRDLVAAKAKIDAIMASGQ